MKTIFNESYISGYPHRTFENASLADITIDFAFESKGSGGNKGLTKIATKQLKKHYINIPIKPDGFDINDAAEIIIAELRKYIIYTDVTINIAGHELGKMQISQEKIDELVKATFNKVLSTIFKDNIYIKSIRSGGQTGFDEAGIKAGIAFDIQTIILAPKNWLYRPDGKDIIGDEKGFKARFKNNT